MKCKIIVAIDCQFLINCAKSKLDVIFKTRLLIILLINSSPVQKPFKAGRILNFYCKQHQLSTKQRTKNRKKYKYQFSFIKKINHRMVNAIQRIFKYAKFQSHQRWEMNIEINCHLTIWVLRFSISLGGIVVLIYYIEK